MKEAHSRGSRVTTSKTLSMLAPSSILNRWLQTPGYRDDVHIGSSQLVLLLLGPESIKSVSSKPPRARF